MVPFRLVLTCAAMVCLAGSVAGQGGAYDDQQTETLVRAAQARHREHGENLSGYTADVFTRSEGTVGTTRWAPDVQVVVHEMLAHLHWQRPNALHVDVLGVRSRSVHLPGVSARDVAGFWTETFAGEPWFAPRYLGDEIQMLDIPDRAARHPLAPDGERWYHYAISDSTRVQVRGRTVRAVGIDVRPRTSAPFPLLTGRIWIDADSLDLVRLEGALTGPGLWEEDDDESPVLVGMEIDLEYGLENERWWLPFRQIVTTHWTYRYLPGADLVGIATSTFTNHHVVPDTGSIMRTTGNERSSDWSTWTCDFGSAGYRCGERDLVHSRHRSDGQWEVFVPPLDSVLAYPFDSAFAFHEELADEDVLTQRLIEMSTWSGVAPGGHPVLTAASLSPFRVIGFNRVRGLSLGTDAMLHLTGSWGLFAGARGSLHEPFWTGEAGFVREDASGRLALLARRHLSAVEPWTPEGGLGPAARAGLLGHDDADWYLAEGAAVSWRGYRGSTRGFSLTVAAERESSVETRSRSVPHDILFGDGDYPPNPAVTEGWMSRVSVSRSWTGFTLGADALAGDFGLGERVWARGNAGRVRALLGAAFGDRVPQLDFRVGGPWTVRGLAYGALRGRRLWAVQADWPVALGPYVSLIPFGDLAGTFEAQDPAAGLGLGVADAQGLLRLDLAVGLRPETTTRFDVTVTLR